MAGYIGSKTSVTQVDGYNRTEADDEFVNDPNGVLNISASASSDALTLGADNTLSVAGKIDAKTAPWVGFSGQIQFGQTGFVANYSGGANVQTLVGNNAYYNGGYRSIQAGTRAVFMNAASGEFSFNNAPATTNAGDALAMTERMKIDSEGRVTMPYQPAFSVTGNTASFVGTNVAGTVQLNVGGHFNNTLGRFTAPVAGNYLFTFSLTTEDTQSHFIDIGLNGSGGSGTVGGLHLHYGTAYQNGSVTTVYPLSVGDFVEAKRRGTGYAVYRATFSGYLVG